MEAVKQVQARFFTKQEKYAIPDVPYSIPANIESEQLILLINGVLKESSLLSDDERIEFDFLIGAELLRRPLERHLGLKEISTESIVDIEYLEKHPSPEPEDCLLHDDWVSAVRVKNNWILSGCYDNTLHLWTLKGKHKLTIPGHTGPIKSVAWIGIQDNVGTFVSTSHDQTAILWQWNSELNSVDCISLLKGHERSVDCVAVDPNQSYIATGSWDTMLKVWSTNHIDLGLKFPKTELSELLSVCLEEDTPSDDPPDPKRAKLDSKNIRTPIMTLQGHKEAVSGVNWISPSEVVTCSFDHTIKIWDIEMQSLKTEQVGNKSFVSIDYSLLNKTLLTSSSDRHVRLYDPRSKEGQMVKATYSSHSGWVSSLHWSQVDENLFISASYDKLVKLWDRRSYQTPLYDMKGHEAKVMCCDWTNEKYFVSGGSDNTMRVYRNKQRV